MWYITITIVVYYYFLYHDHDVISLHACHLFNLVHHNEMRVVITYPELVKCLLVRPLEYLDS